MDQMPVSRRTVLGWGSLAALGTAFGGASAAHAAPTFPEPGKETPLSAIRSYLDMIEQLQSLARSGRYPVTVRTLSQIGTREALSEQGRELYVATVGTGPTPVWVQGRIHGNEPYGLDATMTVLRRLATSGAKEWRRMREELTIHVIPVYNPDGSEANIRETILWDRVTNTPRLDSRGRQQRIEVRAHLVAP